MFILCFVIKNSESSSKTNHLINSLLYLYLHIYICLLSLLLFVIRIGLGRGWKERFSILHFASASNFLKHVYLERERGLWRNSTNIRQQTTFSKIKIYGLFQQKKIYSHLPNTTTQQQLLPKSKNLLVAYYIIIYYYYYYYF